MGHKIKAQYRRENPPAGLAALEDENVKLVRTDLSDKGPLESLVEDVDTVIHIAGLAGDWGPYLDYYQANVLATSNLVKESKRAGVGKFICISSISVHGFGDLLNADEKGPYYKLISNYQRTKKEAEELALAENSDHFKVCVIRPGNVYGPDDHTMIFNIFGEIAKGWIYYISGGKPLTCPLYVTDLVEAIRLACESPESSGQIYNITGGEHVSWKEYFFRCAECLGVKAKVLNFPYPAALAVAALFEGFYKLFRIKNRPLITKYLVEQTSHNYNFSIQKAVDQLGYQPKMDYIRGIELAAESYLQSKIKK